MNKLEFFHLKNSAWLLKWRSKSLLLYFLFWSQRCGYLLYFDFNIINLIIIINNSFVTMERVSCRMNSDSWFMFHFWQLNSRIVKFQKLLRKTSFSLNSILNLLLPLFIILTFWLGFEILIKLFCDEPHPSSLDVKSHVILDFFRPRESSTSPSIFIIFCHWSIILLLTNELCVSVPDIAKPIFTEHGSILTRMRFCTKKLKFFGRS